MEHRDTEIKKLSRPERIREEAKRALEYGQAPKQPLSLHPTFRVEGLTSTAPRVLHGPGTRFLEASRVKVVRSREGHPLLPKESATYLAARIEGELHRLTPENRSQHAAELLGLLSQLHLASPHDQSWQALRRRVLAALFGQAFLEQSERHPSPERGPNGRGGSTGNGGERRE